MRRLPFGARLALAYTAVLAAALLAFTAIAYAAIDHTIRTSLDTRLQATAMAAQLIPDVHHGRIVFDADDRAHFLEVLNDNHVDGATVTLDGTLLISNLQRPPVGILRAIAHSRPGRGLLHTASGDIDYLAFPIVDRQGRLKGEVGAWESGQVYEGLAHGALLALLGTSVFVVLAAVGIGIVVARRALRPLADLSAVMSAIEATDLSERLVWDGPDDELGRLCSAFDRLLDRLEAAFNRERRFSADASHELRTPLSVMRAETELALTRERDGAGYRATLERLRAETYRLEALVEGLLLTARHETGIARAEPAPVGEIVARTSERTRPLLQPRGLTLNVERRGDAFVLGDPQLLESALAALLDNAIRHSPDRGTIRIIVERREAVVTIAVWDEGPGFNAEALRDATRRFWREDRERGRSGHGLGLAIALAIGERHGGSLAVRNDPAGGGVAELRLPALEAYVFGGAGAAADGGSAKSGTIGSTVESSA